MRALALRAVISTGLRTVVAVFVGFSVPIARKTGTVRGVCEGYCTRWRKTILVPFGGVPADGAESNAVTVQSLVKVAPDHKLLRSQCRDNHYRLGTRPGFTND